MMTMARGAMTKAVRRDDAHRCDRHGDFQIPSSRRPAAPSNRSRLQLEPERAPSLQS